MSACEDLPNTEVISTAARGQTERLMGDLNQILGVNVIEVSIEQNI